MTQQHDEFSELLHGIPSEFAQQKLTLTDAELARELSQSAGEQWQPSPELVQLTRRVLEYAARHNS